MGEQKDVVIVNAEGGTMIKMNSLDVEGNRIKINGALMGAWDTDMFIDADAVKAAIGLVPIPKLVKWAAEYLFDIKITKLDS